MIIFSLYNTIPLQADIDKYNIINKTIISDLVRVQEVLREITKSQQTQATEIIIDLYNLYR